MAKRIKRTLTLSDWLELNSPRVAGGVKRAFVFLLLLFLLVLLTAGALTDNAHLKSLPVLGWLCRHKGYATLICAAGSAGSFVIGVFQVWFSQAAKTGTAEHLKRLKEMERRISGEIQDVKDVAVAGFAAQAAADADTQALLKQILLAQGQSVGPQAGASPEATAGAAAAARFLVESPDSADKRARAMIEGGDVAGGFSALKQAAVASETDAAEKWRRLGALAFLVNVAEAIEAYENATRLDPGDCWTHIYLSRLHAAAGSTAKAETAVKSAIAASTNDRDRMCALNDFGDVARAEGDLPAARKAYENSLAIRKDLSARDPGNAEWKRDLSVSYNKLGDVAVAEGDLTAARKAYEDSLAIRKDLSARDPGNTQWKRDLSVSYNNLGDVAVAEGDLTAARKAYEDGLTIAKDLSDRDPANTGWKRDLSVSYERLGDVAVAEGGLPAARKAYEDSFAIRKDISDRDPANTDWKRNLSVVYERLGDVARAEGDLTAARKAYEDSLAIRKDLSARDPGNTEWKRDLAVSYAKLAQTAELKGDLAAACQSFREAERIFREILTLSPSHSETRRMADLAARDAARVCG